MTSNYHIPIVFGQPRQTASDGATILALDIGGTKTDIGLFEVKEQHPVLIQESIYPSGNWPSLEALLEHFLQNIPRPDQLSIAVAGPVINGISKVTNLDWKIDINHLHEKLSIPNITIINDLEAKAYGLAALQAEDFLNIYGNLKNASGNAAIIAPGTGLGEAGLYWDGYGLHPFATEGGHTDFGPRTDLDFGLLRYLQQQYAHVSWERVVSGPGIFTIFQFLDKGLKLKVPPWLRKNLNQMDPTLAISEGARENCFICKESLNLFVKYLTVEASNLVLKLKATGGLFIGGGIVPKIWNKHLESVFLEHFFQVGRMRHLVEKVPINLILNPKTALLGAAYYGAFNPESHYSAPIVNV